MKTKVNYSEWENFKFGDPLAINKFFVCNKETKICCRPNCVMVNNLEMKNNFESFEKQILLVGSLDDEEILKTYTCCQFCMPNLKLKTQYIENSTFVSVNLKLLLKTLKEVNKNINFVEPFEENSNIGFSFDKMILNNKIKEAKSCHSNLTSKRLISKNYSSTKYKKKFLENLKRVEVACKNIALATQVAFFTVKLVDGNMKMFNERINNKFVFVNSFTSSQFSPWSYSPPLHSGYKLYQNNDKVDDNFTWPIKPIKKGCYFMKPYDLGLNRNGCSILSFKELAAKTFLSPWYFHRTFKTLTGLTPKQYEDRCFHYLYSHRNELEEVINSPESIIINANIIVPSNRWNNNNCLQYLTVPHKILGSVLMKNNVSEFDDSTEIKTTKTLQKKENIYQNTDYSYTSDGCNDMSFECLKTDNNISNNLDLEDKLETDLKYIFTSDINHKDIINYSTQTNNNQLNYVEKDRNISEVNLQEIPSDIYGTNNEITDHIIFNQNFLVHQLKLQNYLEKRCYI